MRLRSPTGSGRTDGDPELAADWRRDDHCRVMVPSCRDGRPCSGTQPRSQTGQPSGRARKPACWPAAGRFWSVRVLVAEDDENLGAVLARGLREHGYVVDLVPDGETAANYLRFYSYDVAVLDWRMPRLSGLDLVQKLRRAGAGVPVLMLTARDTTADRITGLDAGADDYLVKPFDFGELLARLRALQRRPAASQPPRMVIGEVELDPATRQVLVRGQSPALTATEL